MWSRLTLLFLCAMILPAQTPDPAYESLSKAFAALHSLDYDRAIPLFREAASLAPARADIQKNLAYTLLKTGETEAARVAFGEASRLAPGDDHVALEYAFLCFEAREETPARKAEARRIFLRVREQGREPALRDTAARAFAGIDESLGAGIARWRQALQTSTPTFSAHYELAQLAEQRDELEMAAGNYAAAFRLLPERKSVLLDLARVEQARANPEGAMAAWLAASRGGEPRASELARERMPVRYPFVYEFRGALQLDPANHGLHRELAYLLLSMSDANRSLYEEAEKEFAAVVAAAPRDYLASAQLGLLYLADDRESDAMPLLRAVLAHGDSATANRVRMALHLPLVLEERTSSEAPLDPRALGERSYQAGFLKDALRYFTQAREANPVDSSVALKLGWTNNLLHDDATALKWFGIARRSEDAAVASEARRAYANLSPGVQRFRTTLWMYPLYSSRWSDAFGYGQLKTELRIRNLALRPYLSTRFIGDLRRQATGAYGAQSLSESAFIFAAGIAAPLWRGSSAWFEAGSATSYLNGMRWNDLRGGVTWSRTRGASLAAEQSGWFLETSADSVYVSHFGNDLINYSQNRFGYTTIRGGGADGLRLQPFVASNLTFDVKGQYWANFADVGPGLRIHLPGTPQSMALTISGQRGVYLKNEGSPRRPNFFDVRAGVWYAFTK